MQTLLAAFDQQFRALRLNLLHFLVSTRSHQKRMQSCTAGRAGAHRALLSCAQMDGEREALAELPTASPGRRARATNMAYIIFTSGSTGRPKGTVLQHDGAISFLLDHTWCVMVLHDT